MITQDTIREAVPRLVDAADPAEIILFGSHATGEAANRLEQIVIWTGSN